MRGNGPCFESASRGGEIVVTVDARGIVSRVRVCDDAIELPVTELASRIVRLSAMASLRRLRALGGGDSGAALGASPLTDAQIEAYSATIDF